VTYIYPTVDEKTRTAKVRMEFHNPGFFLKPGMFATVQIEAELAAEAVLVPDAAVLRSGESNTVFVALDGGKFQPRNVTLGARSENYQYQVLSGLKAGERVVISGQFMLDSESQLREAIQKMLEPQAAPTLSGVQREMPPRETAPRGASSASDDGISFVCPMPEHLSIKYQRPGNCPLCGMELVPVRNDELAKLEPGGMVDHYTCPMPEHADVHEKTPGKCPRCGMTLIPVMIAPATARGTESPAPSPSPDPKH